MKKLLAVVVSSFLCSQAARADFLVQPNDVVGVCGDSITEQHLYSAFIEDYLLMCQPTAGQKIVQFGWSGEQASGFPARMTNDVLRFAPTVATTCYGMNDHHYRPYEESIGMAYASNMTDIVLAFQSAGAKVIIGSPGCMGFKLPPWPGVTGTPKERNLSLCVLRNIDIEIASLTQAGFADVFWPMYTAQFQARQQWGAQYSLSGKDSVHPGWAGHLVMAYAFLKALDLPGDIGTFNVDLKSGQCVVSAGHRLISSANGTIKIESSRYPFCAMDSIDNDDSIRSGMALVPFNQDLNRLILIARNGKAKRYKVTWGDVTREYTGKQLKQGVNLAEDFPVNPFCDAFKDVDEAVSTKQIYETKQIKELFHGSPGKTDMEKTVIDSELVRAALVDAIKSACVPVTHTITIKPVI